MSVYYHISCLKLCNLQIYTMGLSWSDLKSWKTLAGEKEESLQSKLRAARRRPNVLVFGLPGAGKSALISSIVASITHDPDVEVAESGKFTSGRSHTLCFQVYQTFGSNESSNQQDRWPIFYDMPGFGNLDDDLQNAILSCILDGKIPVGEQILKKVTKEEDVMERFDKSDTSLLIDRVIFVHSAEVEVPENLAGAIVDICRERGITLFGVLTHTDLVNQETKFSRNEDFEGAIGTAGTSCSGALQLYHKGMQKYGSIPENFETNCYMYMLLTGLINQNYSIRSTS